MRTIVAATDFSTGSLNAVNYAADMSRALGARLVLIHVVVVPSVFAEIPVTGYALEQLEEDARYRMGELKDDIVMRVHDEVYITTEVYRGDVIVEIDEACQRHQPYAVIMGAESMGPVERWLADGKTMAAIRHLEWPLLAVPTDAKFSTIRRIGLACNLTHGSETIPANEIRELVHRFQATLHILHINKESDEDLSEEKLAESERLKEILSDLNPRFHFIFDEEVESGIQAWSDTQQLDMLIIIPRKHKFPASLFHRRRSPRLVMHAHIPVLVSSKW